MALPETPGTFITFDAPGACEKPSFPPGCTIAVAINPAGDILGYSVDASGIEHGFLRDGRGTFNPFNVQGAGEYTLAFFGQGPPGSSLNSSGEATGGYFDSSSVFHGFVRDRGGAITTFDAPGADTTPGHFNGTFPISINAAGEVTGYYFDANSFFHGFVRDVKGNVTDFDPPGYSSACFGIGFTFPTAINAAGEIVGQYVDSECYSHGFMRERNGAITVVDDPSFLSGIVPLTINNGGLIAGGGFDEFGNAQHWFVRDNRGSFATFDTPDVRDFIFMDINPAGVIVGSWADSNLVIHSFRRTPDGTLTAINFPGAGTGTFGGTNAASINPAGVITGNYTDVNGVSHAFLFLPQ
jgi:hypothetical protein